MHVGQLAVEAVVIEGEAFVVEAEDGRQLAPAEDQGVIFTFINAPEHTNLDYLTTYTDNLTDTFLKVPEKQNLFAINGFPTTHSAFMGLILKPWGERSRSDMAVMGELQPKFKQVSGVNVFATAPSAIPWSAMSRDSRPPAPCNNSGRRRSPQATLERFLERADNRICPALVPSIRPEA